MALRDAAVGIFSLVACEVAGNFVGHARRHEFGNVSCLSCNDAHGWADTAGCSVGKQSLDRCKARYANVDWQLVAFSADATVPGNDRLCFEAELCSDIHVDVMFFCVSIFL